MGEGAVSGSGGGGARVRTRVAALGDSITWGFPGGPMTSWVQRVADRLGLEMINLGVNGASLADMTHRVAQGVACAAPVH